MHQEFNRDIMMQNSQTRVRKEFAQLQCDFMFKRLFGSEANKDVLIGFLNMILEDVEIADVTFIPTEHLGLTKEDRKSVFDISCKCKDGRRLIIEMQRGYQKHFRKRAVFYTSYPINEQGRKAREEYIRDHGCKDDGQEFRWDYNLKPVTVVALLNFKFDHDSGWPAERFHSSYRLREDATGEVMTDVLRYVFLELARFRKSIDELQTRFDKWMYLLCHMHELTEIPEKFQDPEFKRLFLLSEIGNFTPDELAQYLESLGNMSDYYNIIDSTAELAEKRGHDAGVAEGLAKGRQEGREEGLAKGREEGRRATALNLKGLGVDVLTIAQATGLSGEEIENL